MQILPHREESLDAAVAGKVKKTRIFVLVNVTQDVFAVAAR